MASAGVAVSLSPSGPLAQLARALASHARGHKFKSCTVHHKNPLKQWVFRIDERLFVVEAFGAEPQTTELVGDP